MQPSYKFKFKTNKQKTLGALTSLSSTWDAPFPGGKLAKTEQ